MVRQSLSPVQSQSSQRHGNSSLIIIIINNGNPFSHRLEQEKNVHAMTVKNDIRCIT